MTWPQYRARLDFKRKAAVAEAKEYAERTGTEYAVPYLCRVKANKRTQQRIRQDAKKAAGEAPAPKRAPRRPVAASARPPAAAENASSSTAAPSKRSCEAASAPETPTDDMTYTPPDEPTTPADEPMFIKPLVKEPPGKEESVGEEEPGGEEEPPEEDAATAEASAEASADPAGVPADPAGVPAAAIPPAEDIAASVASVASVASCTSTTAVCKGTAGDLAIPGPPPFPPPGFFSHYRSTATRGSRARTTVPRVRRQHSQSSASRSREPDYPMPSRLPPFSR